MVDSRCRSDRVEAPLARNAFELSTAPFDKPDAGARDQILDRLRDEYVARSGVRSNACTDRDGNARDLSVHDLAFAGVQPGAQLES